MREQLAYLDDDSSDDDPDLRFVYATNNPFSVLNDDADGGDVAQCDGVGGAKRVDQGIAGDPGDMRNKRASRGKKAKIGKNRGRGEKGGKKKVGRDHVGGEDEWMPRRCASTRRGRRRTGRRRQQHKNRRLREKRRRRRRRQRRAARRNGPRRISVRGGAITKGGQVI